MDDFRVVIFGMMSEARIEYQFSEHNFAPDSFVEGLRMSQLKPRTNLAPIKIPGDAKIVPESESDLSQEVVDGIPTPSHSKKQPEVGGNTFDVDTQVIVPPVTSTQRWIRRRLGLGKKFWTKTIPYTNTVLTQLPPQGTSTAG